MFTRIASLLLPSSRKHTADYPLVPDVKPEQVLNQIALLAAQQALPHCRCCDDRHIVQGCEPPIVLACVRDWQPRTRTQLLQWKGKICREAIRRHLFCGDRSDERRVGNE